MQLMIIIFYNFFANDCFDKKFPYSIYCKNFIFLVNKQMIFIKGEIILGAKKFHLNRWVTVKAGAIKYGYFNITKACIILRLTYHVLLAFLWRRGCTVLVTLVFYCCNFSLNSRLVLSINIAITFFSCE